MTDRLIICPTITGNASSVPDLAGLFDDVTPARYIPPMARRRNTSLEAKILALLTEWHPQHLTAEELALLAGNGSSTTFVRALLRELEAAGKVRIEAHAHQTPGASGQGRHAYYLAT